MNTAANDNFLLSEFKKAIQKNAGEPVLNLDDKFPHKFDFFVKAYEEIVERVGHTIPPHKWSYYRIGLLKEGLVDFVCGIYKFKARKNTLVMIPARVINTSTNWTSACKGYVVLFNLDFFLQSHFPHKHIESKKIFRSSVQPYVHLTQKQADTIELIFKTIVEENRNNDPHKVELIAVKIIELLILIERFYTEDVAVNIPTQDMIKRFSELVEANFSHEKSVAFYASQLNIHPNYLNALVKTHTGLTAKESIQNRLLLEAKYLLHTTPLSIKEISNQMGFDDPNYFTVFFKRFENLSPAAYRSSFV